jgi:alkane 1-monooxygenase
MLAPFPLSVNPVALADCPNGTGGSGGASVWRRGNFSGELIKTYTLTTDDGGVINYSDGKRYLWAAALLYPLIALGAIGGWFYTGSDLTLLLPLAFFYGVVPFADIIAGNDENNPPEALVPQLEADKYYRYLTWALIPFYFLVLGVSAWFVGTQPLSLRGFVAVSISGGVFAGTAITLGHELGHKRSALDKLLARIVLAVPAYGHFAIEHNRGHHTQVATPEDPASSRMGETIYSFALREMPGALRRGWRLERERLERMGKPALSLDNEVLQSWALTAILDIALIAAFGWIMLPFLTIHHVLAWWQLTSANYIEHYGLLRSKRESGRYEPCQPRHSWNSNHIVSNLLSLHLERHSDHHANPTRSYQALRHFDDAPELPGGYAAMFLLAYVSRLWFQVMDPRVVEWAGGDLEKVNIAPERRERLEARYGAATAA